ncbi:MAG: dolichol-phosphate mannosyltransferase [Thermonema sp.]|uniref:polyprenol monophosphomannose synthase n=1 Tax=Thermonema sp. TaxID=2231181 RepID=UPI0021DC2592|nr:polyprenol monophosphomannose synthase [Thermonema sp.]GIV39696.1 MAG: dolichol-phosphate mannosyltransferase [Thermonema sp.]
MSDTPAVKGIVVVPTYNEIENIEPLIRTVMGLAVPFDLLVIDDGSPDGTAARVRALQQEYPGRLHLIERPGKQGLGTAYITGFRYALAHGYDYVFEMDADFSHNPHDLLRLYAACAEEGYDVAIGSRYITGVNVVNWPMKRVLLSYFASQYVQFITGMPVKDATAGFKCYRREVLETIDLDSIAFVGYAFQIAVKFQAWKYGFKLKEVPIVFTERTRGQSKMSFRIFKEAFWGVIKLKIESLFKSYRRPMAQPLKTTPQSG